MFTKARLRLTLVYAGLLSLTVVLVAGAIGVFAVQDVRRTGDRELQIRATAIADGIPQDRPPARYGPPPFGGRGPDDHGPRGGLEARGSLEYVLPVDGGQPQPPFDNAVPGLPDIAAAQRAVQTNAPRYTTLTVQGSQVRMYSVPVARNGQTVAVVQVVRSLYFVNAAVTRLALISLGAGLIGLALSAAAGYWLAGGTLRPIAAALERQRAFAADASHELRTPLTVLLTNAELLSRHPERTLAEYQDVVADIIAEIERLSRLVGDLLTLARADQGKAGLALHEVNLAEIGGTVARQFTPIAAAKGVAVQVESAPGVFVSGDQDRLQQLAVILIDNAVRYTAQGSVTVRIAQEGNNAILAVGDTGAGIAPEHLPHLFERFYRTDAARSTEEGGMGLGLAIAEWIVHSHHGHIEVTSTPGQGSTFTVRLPAIRPPAHDRARTLAPAAPGGEGGGPR